MEIDSLKSVKSGEYTSRNLEVDIIFYLLFKFSKNSEIRLPLTILLKYSMGVSIVLLKFFKVKISQMEKAIELILFDNTNEKVQNLKEKKGTRENL